MEELPANVVARLRTSGGLLPQERVWFFYADGRVRRPDGTDAFLPQQTAEELLGPTRLDSLAALASDYPAPPGAADAVSSELTFRTSAGVRRITASDAADGAPESFWEYWDDLQAAAQAASPSRQQ